MTLGTSCLKASSSVGISSSAFSTPVSYTHLVRKYRGSLPICVGKYITDRLVERDDIEDSLVFISSCQPKPGCMDAVKAGLKKYASFKECHETDIGTTIGGYSGPGTIGIVFARKEK